MRERRSSSKPLFTVRLLSFKSVGELPSKVAAVVHRGGMRFTFDGNSNTSHRRQTVVEGFKSLQVSKTLRKREAPENQESNAIVIEEKCVEMLKEPKGGACSAVTGPSPPAVGKKAPRTSRRGTEILW